MLSLDMDSYADTGFLSGGKWDISEGNGLLFQAPRIDKVEIRQVSVYEDRDLEHCNLGGGDYGRFDLV